MQNSPPHDQPTFAPDIPTAISGPLAKTLNQAFNANLARMTMGISPAGAARVYFDWLSQLALSPGTQLQLDDKGRRKLARLRKSVALR